ncbi:MAG: hypothetical protein QE285_12905 [Aquabacterium sp.]|nr:hypothetical protein [Aquabacterium sp.]
MFINFGLASILATPYGLASTRRRWVGVEQRLALGRQFAEAVGHLFERDVQCLCLVGRGQAIHIALDTHLRAIERKVCLGRLISTARPIRFGFSGFSQSVVSASALLLGHGNN